MNRNRHKSGGAFTLLELLLALALIAMLLVAMNMFVFSMGELWGRGSDRRLFDRHVRSVTRYLETILRTAVLPPATAPATTAPATTAPTDTAQAATTPADTTTPAATPPADNSGAGAAAASSPAVIAPQEVSSPFGGTDNLLTFELIEGARVLPWPGKPLPDVVCSLAVREGEGLMLYWHSRVESKFADDPPRATVLSPFVTALSYDYYDPAFKRWHTETNLQKGDNGQWLPPTRVRVRFVFGDLQHESQILLPTAGKEGLPPF